MGEVLNDVVLVVIVGPPGQGKSAVAHALSRQDGAHRHSSAADGGDQFVWSQKAGPLLGASRKLTFVTWDFGEEASEVAHAAVLPGLAAIYLVVCNMERGLVRIC